MPSLPYSFLTPVCYLVPVHILASCPSQIYVLFSCNTLTAGSATRLL